jgi:CBS domain containing-hemolysin-like protein
MSFSVQILIIFGCLLGTAFFAGMETGIISIHRLRLRHLVKQRDSRAIAVQRLLHRPEHFLGTTLTGTNLCTVMASVTGARLATRLLGSWGPPVSEIALTLILLICCEYLPKAWFRSYPAGRTLPFVPLLQWSGYVLYPVSRVVTWVTLLMLPAARRSSGQPPAHITRDDMQYLVREAEQAGMLSRHEGKMIHGVFELTQKTVDLIMRPWHEVILVSADTPLVEFFHIARTRAIKRMPVYHQTPDRIIGIINVLDAVIDPHPETRTVRDFTRPPQFIPADTLMDELLPRMRLTRQPMGLVTDGRGHICGLVTLNDVLGEIVGKL